MPTFDVIEIALCNVGRVGKRWCVCEALDCVELTCEDGPRRCEICCESIEMPKQKGFSGY